jgi:uncharacterized Zn-binding protein involved in type VI secretion
MNGIIRIVDIDSRGDHMVEASGDVFVNGRGASRLGDRDNRNHVIVSGCSENVFVNGIQCGKLMATDSRGDRMISASSNVFVG